MIVPLMFFVAAWSYPFCVNFVPAYRNIADSFHEAKVGIVNTDDVSDPEMQHGFGTKEGSPMHSEAVHHEQK
jgi:FHS family L-fucose permease-like MFS transporter